MLKEYKSSDSNVKIICDTDAGRIYKYCDNSGFYENYLYFFDSEYNKMKELQTKMGDRAYSALFPVYHELGQDKDHRPCIIMEYIGGNTLEKWLSERPSSGPHKYLNRRQLSHLFSQLTDAEEWLSKVDMLQLDLNPGNIIITDERSFDIKLIDFTDSYYLSEDIRQKRLECYNRSYKIIDDCRADRQLDNYPSLQLRDMGILLFTRLFYRGNGDYNNSYDHSSRFFDDYSVLFNSRYPGTIDLGAVPANDLLYYWNQWVHVLEDIQASANRY